MEKVKLVYFQGCPEAKHARAALLTSGIAEFEVVLQDQLKDEDPFKSYSSPTILKGDKVIYGNKLNAGSSACSFQKIDFGKIQSELMEGEPGKVKNGQKKGAIVSAFGAIGSGLAVGLCPLCIPAIGAFLTSVGLGVVVQDAVLKPALLAMLAMTLGGFLWSYFKKHGSIFPFVLGLISAGGMYIGRYVYINSNINFILMYGSIFALIGIAIWNLYLNRKSRQNSSCPACVIPHSNS